VIKCKKRQPFADSYRKSFFDIAPRSLTIIAYLRPIVKTFCGVLYSFCFCGGYTDKLRLKQKELFYIMDFLKILKQLTEADNLTFSDICVMAVLVTYAQYGDDQSVEMSYSDIHAEFKRIPIVTIRCCIQRLAANGYIQIIRNGTQKNRYKVLIPIPEIKAKTTYSKKPSNKIASSDDYVAEAKRVMLKNPFLQ